MENEFLFTIMQQIALIYITKERFYFIELMSVYTLQNTINGRGIYPFNKGLRIYGKVYHPPFHALKKCTSTYDMKLKLYR